MKPLNKSNFTFKPLKEGVYWVTYTSNLAIAHYKAVITDLSKVANVLNSTNPSYMALHELRALVLSKSK